MLEARVLLEVRVLSALRRCEVIASECVPCDSLRQADAIRTLLERVLFGEGPVGEHSVREGSLLESALLEMTLLERIPLESLIMYIIVIYYHG